LKFITTYRNGLQQDFENLPQLLGYLYKIIKTTALDQVRKLMGKQFKAQFPKGELPPDIPEDVRKRLSFQVLVDELPRDGQQVVELKFEWLCTEAEIGQLLGISRHMVRETYSRAMIRLKKDFDDPGKKDSVLHVANEEI
jgi:RNA polymerase sigma factor (sigma-70 family)